MEVETVTVRERMLAVMEALELRETLGFEELLGAGAPVSRALVVATFLALLELARLAAIRLYQSLDDGGVPRGPIHVRRAVDPRSAPWSEQIAEVM